jgi:2'-phosphotransferase
MAADEADLSRYEAMAERVEDGGAGRRGGAGGKRGGGKGGRGGGGGGGGRDRREGDLSRALSRLLRHQAANAGIQLDREGFAPLDRVVSFFFYLSLSFLCPVM